MLNVNFIEPAFHLNDILRMPLDIRCLALETTGRLMHHDARIIERKAHVFFPGAKAAVSPWRRPARYTTSQSAGE